MSFVLFLVWSITNHAFMKWTLLYTPFGIYTWAFLLGIYLGVVLLSYGICLWVTLKILLSRFQFSSVQSLSRVRLFVTPWTAAHQAFLVITNSQSLLKLMSIELVTPPTISSSVVPFSSCLQSFPASGSFQMSQFFTSGGQSIGASASTSVLRMNNQDWPALGWTGWISFESRGFSRIIPNTTLQTHQFFCTQLSL